MTNLTRLSVAITSLTRQSVANCVSQTASLLMTSWASFFVITRWKFACWFSLHSLRSCQCGWKFQKKRAFLNFRLEAVLRLCPSQPRGRLDFVSNLLFAPFRLAVVSARFGRLLCLKRRPSPWRSSRWQTSSRGSRSRRSYRSQLSSTAAFSVSSAPKRGAIGQSTTTTTTITTNNDNSDVDNNDNELNNNELNNKYQQTLDKNKLLTRPDSWILPIVK